MPARLALRSVETPKFRAFNRVSGRIRRPFRLVSNRAEFKRDLRRLKSDSRHRLAQGEADSITARTSCDAAFVIAIVPDRIGTPVPKRRMKEVPARLEYRGRVLRIGSPCQYHFAHQTGDDRHRPRILSTVVGPLREQTTHPLDQSADGAGKHIVS
jgi:hypothetical protein